MVRKTFVGLALLLALAACNATPPPAPTGPGEPPPAPPSDTPSQATEEGSPGYPVQGETADPGQPYPVETEGANDEAGYPVETDESGYPAPPEEDCVLEDAAPQRHELTSLDGTDLVGTFYPAASCDAPLVILFHQLGSHKDAWSDLALWMQNRGDEIAFSGKLLAVPRAQYAWFPDLPEDLSLAVFALDFRDHGESEDTDSGLDGPGFLMDAQAALDYARTLTNIDPDRVITMGASIGSDASVDVCLALDGDQPAVEQSDKGCIGAMTFSPGSYLGPLYEEVVGRLAEPPFNVHIHCIATEFDGPSPDLCQAELPGSIEHTVYAGRSEHGMAMLREGFDPDIGIIIHDFLLTVLGLDGE